jgi:hypothetical protein
VTSESARFAAGRSLSFSSSIVGTARRDGAEQRVELGEVKANEAARPDPVPLEDTASDVVADRAISDAEILGGLGL